MTAYHTPPHLHMVSMPVPCPSLFSWIHLSHPYLSHQMKKQLSRLSIHHHRPPVPGSITVRQEMQLGGHKHSSSSRHLCAPSAARSSSPPPSPTPQPSPNSDMHNCIPTFSPLFIPMRMPQPPPTAPLTCVFRHARLRPYLRIQTHTTAPLSSLPFPIQLQHLTSMAD